MEMASLAELETLAEAAAQALGVLGAALGEVIGVEKMAIDVHRATETMRTRADASDLAADLLRYAVRWNLEKACALRPGDAELSELARIYLRD